jgi:hypothetical protein
MFAHICPVLSKKPNFKIFLQKLKLELLSKKYPKKFSTSHKNNGEAEKSYTIKQINH